jgi:hypothetical protein
MNGLNTVDGPIWTDQAMRASRLCEERLTLQPATRHKASRIIKESSRGE